MWSIHSGISAKNVFKHFIICAEEWSVWWSVRLISTWVLRGGDAVSPSCTEDGSKCCRLPHISSRLWTTSPVTSLGLCAIASNCFLGAPGEHKRFVSPPSSTWALFIIVWIQDKRTLKVTQPPPSPQPTVWFHWMFENLLKPWSILLEDYVAILIE